MNWKRLPCLLAVLAALMPGSLVSAASAASSAWPAVGPDGGDARRFAFDPRDASRIYLGTTNSWIYLSTDGGSSWTRLAKLGTQDNLVVDSLVVDRSDPHTLIAGVWVMDHPDGGVFVSHDEGHSWTEAAGIKGQAVLGMTEAPSRPRVLVAGTLTGVFRSDDSGQNWREISPPGSTEVHEVQSVAIDPYDPDTIYAGTWHLPWKTTDGGAHWKSIKEGLIDDSDVFSIIIDRSRPSVLFASACSGIYRTDDGGMQFRKVQGIPSTARRTRVLTMDPADRNTVYAGTTEGLYITHDGGDNWTRTTGADVIVNDVYVDPRNPKHVLLATDRGGVEASEDAAVNFQASNTGFSQRQVAALLADTKTPGTMYAGVVNGKTYGGVFVTGDFGATWKQQSEGLGGADVFELAQGADGALLAGTSHGIFRWDGSSWAPDDGAATHAEAVSAAPKRHAGRRTRPSVRRTAAKKASDEGQAIRGAVRALAVSGNTWYAATDQGVFRSTTDGATWEGPLLGGHEEGARPTGSAGVYSAVAVDGDTLCASRREGIMLSADRGARWAPVIYPSGLTAVNALAVTPDGAIWAGGREGVYFTSDHGTTWSKLSKLPVVDINSVAWNSTLGRIVLTSSQSTLIFAIDPADKTWKWWNAGWTVHSVASQGGRLAAASMFSGVVAEPQPETASVGEAAQPAQR